MTTDMKTWKILLVLAAAALASCTGEEPLGKWDPMVWKADVPVATADGAYAVAATGAELTFTCVNYSSPWIENAFSGGEYYYPPREVDDFHTITTGWLRAETRGDRLHVAFDANETAGERVVLLTVTAGDIFHTFKFRQAANE